MKKHLCAIFCLLLALSGCKSDKTVDTETNAPPVSTETVEDAEKKGAGANLPEVDYDGYDFTILTLNDYSRRYHLTADETNGEPLNDATYDRNNKIYDTIGAEIVTFEVGATPGAGDVANELQNAVAAGDVTYSMILPHPNADAGLLKMVAGGLLYNQNELPVVDWDKPWWNDNARQALSIGNIAYLASGDYSLTCQGMQAILFNKDLMADLGIDMDLYETVRAGKWTMDTMLPLVELAGMDLNGDGKMTKDDRYGILLNNIGNSWQVALGQPFTAKDENGFPRSALKTERMQQIVELCCKMASSDACFTTTYSYADYESSDFKKIFTEGRTLFAALDIGGLYATLRDIDFNFGIIPTPKFDEAQDGYKTFCGAGIEGVPINIEDPERTGVILEALSYYSYEYQRPVFFDIILENKAVRDRESYEMITIMHEGKTFDFGFNLDPSGKLANMLQSLTQSKSTNFSSLYTSLEPAIEAKFNDFYANLQLDESFTATNAGAKPQKQESTKEKDAPKADTKEDPSIMAKEKHPKKTDGVVYENADTFFGYCGWPTVCADDDGTLYTVYSGFRGSHVCPFGKTCLSRSRDGGKTWSIPAIVNDTWLDDRDAGIVSLGGSRLMVTWFTNPADSYHTGDHSHAVWVPSRGLVDALYPTVPESAKNGGSYYRVSEDGGETWGELCQLPISAPHGPTLRSDGSIIYMGKELWTPENPSSDNRVIRAMESRDGGKTFTDLGIVPLPDGLAWGDLHEPHVIELPDGTLLGAIRAHRPDFTVFLTRSEDGGKTWSMPEQMDVQGSPPHLMVHSSGAVILTFGRRVAPYGERAVVSYDNGRTWDTEYVLRDDGPDSDLGYPATVELSDGSLVTVYYQRVPGDQATSILYTKWELQ